MTTPDDLPDESFPRSPDPGAGDASPRPGRRRAGPDYRGKGLGLGPVGNELVAVVEDLADLVRREAVVNPALVEALRAASLALRDVCRQMAADMTDAARVLGEQTVVAAQEGVDSTRAAIRARPLQSIATAGLAGLAIGLLLWPGRQPDERASPRRR